MVRAFFVFFGRQCHHCRFFFQPENVCETSRVTQVIIIILWLANINAYTYGIPTDDLCLWNIIYYNCRRYVYARYVDKIRLCVYCTK